ncbi:hypothetical protein [Rathayibacter toxicus]|uniref:hypothetical protein n=1 Tax=Rathayibacter toxicus TaxID=145458 RepID=UPI001C03F36B|nr:hypothetical protein [Rathayibacter toxicus]QWL29589.1 hypothetical protein E2R34_01630 [Rathayibacter toxicus]
MRRLVVLILLPLIGALLAGCARPADHATQAVAAVPPAAHVPAADPALLKDAEKTAATPVRLLPNSDWLRNTAATTGIPLRALTAYAGAALRTATLAPRCRLGWTTLAGIGENESHHGTIHGSTLGDDGRTTPPLYGPRLDGSEFIHVPDSDSGALDGDPEYDHAMGPLQIIPTTWKVWASPGWDPQNIDQQAVAAARYLCHSGGDLSTEAGWRAAITAYNPARSYLDKVAHTALTYASSL